MRVAIDARLDPALSGGVAQWVLGIAGALSALPESGDRYVFITNEGAGDWLNPYLGGGCESLELPRAVTTKIGTRFPLLRPAWRRLKSLKGSVDSPPGLDRVLDRNRVDVVHFPFQEAFDTSRPYIYQPWDLQHLHLPGFFTQETIARRESEYRKHVARSSRVIVASEWTRRDLIQRYDVSAEKVSVVNVPPVNSFYPPASEAAVARVRDDYALPERYFLYPAQTYPHKNHLALVEAIALAKSRGNSVFVVCSGNRTDHYPSIRKLAKELKVDDRLVFVGFVDEADLQALYSASDGLVFPSLFEGWGLPIFEAFAHGRPVACSKAALLPDLVADAAIVFDPHDPSMIATALVELQTNRDLWLEMVDRGRRRVALFDWRDTAGLLRAHYRELAGERLEPDEELLLKKPPLV